MQSSEELARIEEDKELFSSAPPKSRKAPGPVYRPYVPKNNSIAQFNRHTGEPHEHKREIARRRRQSFRSFYNEANTGCPPGHGCQSHLKID